MNLKLPEKLNFNKDFVVIEGAQPDEPVIVNHIEGEMYHVCEEMVRRYNEFPWTNDSGEREDMLREANLLRQENVRAREAAALFRGCIRFMATSDTEDAAIAKADALLRNENESSSPTAAERGGRKE